MKKDKLLNVFIFVLFQVCSLLIIIGISISSIFILNYPQNYLGQILPIVILFGISSILKSVYIYFINKEYNLIKFHMKKNLIIYDWIAILINIFNMIFVLCFITIASKVGFWMQPENKNFVILLIGVSFSISLVSIGFHQYFMYKVKAEREKIKKGE